jgi:hypothetical protein
MKSSLLSPSSIERFSVNPRVTFANLKEISQEHAHTYKIQKTRS